MFFQKIQQKKALCKLISATFLLNSVGTPVAFAAEDASAELTTGLKTDTNATKSTTATNTDKTAAGTSLTEATGTTATSTSSTTDETLKVTADNKTKTTTLKDPEWAFKSDGKTALTADELKALNYKDTYSDEEIANIKNYLNWYGYDWLLSHGFNVSLTKKASDGSTYLTIPHRTVQSNSTTSDGTTKGADSQTATTCKDGTELVNGTCMTKCETGQSRASDGTCKSEKTCPVGQTMDSSGNCKALDCASKNQDTFEKSDGTQVCVDKCNVNKGEYRNKATGACDTLTKTDVENCPTNKIKNTEKGTCDTCPDGQVPNDDQSACVAKDDGSTSSSSKSSKKKGLLSKLETAAGLWAMFGGKSRSTPSANSQTDERGKEGGVIPGYTAINNGKPDVKLHIYKMDGKATAEVQYPTIGDGPYYAKIDIGKAPASGLTRQRTVVAIQSVPGQGFTYVSPQKKILPGAEFELISKENPLPRAGKYYVIVHIKYTDDNGKIFVASRKIPLLVVEGVTALSSDQDKFLKEGATDVNLKTDVIHYGITEAKIVSAEWKNGSCQLVVSGANVYSEGEQDTLGKNVAIDSAHVSQDNCSTEKLQGKTAEFSSVEVDPTTGHFTDDGETNVDGLSPRSWDEKTSEEKDQNTEAFHKYAEQNGDFTFYDNVPVGKNNKTGKYVDYTGHELTEDEMKQVQSEYDIDLSSATSVTNEKTNTTSLATKDGKEISMDAKHQQRMKYEAQHSQYDGKYRDFTAYIPGYQNADTKAATKNNHAYSGDQVVQGAMSAYLPGSTLFGSTDSAKGKSIGSDEKKSNLDKGKDQAKKAAGVASNAGNAALLKE